MKILIWIGCIIVASIIKFLIFRDANIGAIPTLIIYGAAFGAAGWLCSLYDKKIQSDMETLPVESNNVSFSNEEAKYVHKAIARGATFDEAREEYKRLVENHILPNPPHKNDDNDGDADRISDNTDVIPTEPVDKQDRLTTKMGTNDSITEERNSKECPNCGHAIPADSEFCQYCGNSLIMKENIAPSPIAEEVNEPIADNMPQSAKMADDIREKAAIAAPITKATIHMDIPVDVLEEKASKKTIVEAPKINTATENNKTKTHHYCKKCGGEIDANTRKCGSCGKQYFRPKSAIPIIVLGVVALALAGLNVWQYYLGRQARTTIDQQEERILSLNTSVSNLQNQVEELNEENGKKQTRITALNERIDALNVYANEYNKMCSELGTGKIGYATYNFNVDQSVVIVKKGDKTKTVKLTAYWYNGGSVSVDYSSINARLSFDEDSWYNTTTLSVTPIVVGTTVVTFSNTVDDETFKMLIIVTD